MTKPPSLFRFNLNRILWLACLPTLALAQGGANTTFEPKSIEAAALASLSAVSSEPGIGPAFQAEVALGFRRRWAAFGGVWFTPSYDRFSAETSQKYRVYQFGVQRQISYLRVGGFDLYPYMLGSFGWRRTDTTAGNVATGVFSEDPLTQPVFVWGGGARFLRHSRSRIGWRIEYRMMGRASGAFDFGQHHMISAGVLFQRKPSGY